METFQVQYELVSLMVWRNLCVQSVVHLVFRDEKDPRTEFDHWQYWHSQQPNPLQRAFDIGECGKCEEFQVFYCICWLLRALHSPANTQVQRKCQRRKKSYSVSIRPCIFIPAYRIQLLYNYQLSSNLMFWVILLLQYSFHPFIHMHVMEQHSLTDIKCSQYILCTFPVRS